MAEMANRYQKLLEVSWRRGERILKLDANGKTRKEIAVMFGVTEQRIQQIIKQTKDRLSKQPA